LVREGYDFWHDDVPAFKGRWEPFRAVLDHIAERPCPGCRADGGYPPCPVRACVRERGFATCADCAEWPCDRAAFLACYVNLRGDVERLREIGLERWGTEQEERAATGFCYADIRHPRKGEEWAESPSE
jgi:hypothetical protein